MDGEDLRSWLALIVALISAAVSIFFAIRNDRRVSALEREGDVVWELELNDSIPGWINLRNTGRRIAEDVRVVTGGLDMPPGRWPEGEPSDTAHPNKSLWIELDSLERVTKLPDTLDVVWSVRPKLRRPGGEPVHRKTILTRQLREAAQQRLAEE